MCIIKEKNNDKKKGRRVMDKEDVINNCLLFGKGFGLRDIRFQLTKIHLKLQIPSVSF